MSPCPGASRAPGHAAAFPAAGYRWAPTPVRNSSSRKRPPACGSSGGVGAPAGSAIPASSSSSASSRSGRGVQPSSSRARRVYIVGTASPMSSQPGGAGCRRARKVRSASARTSRVGHGHGPRAQHAGQLAAVEHRVGGDVVGAARVGRERGEPVGLADVGAVHALHDEPRRQRQDRQAAGLQQRARAGTGRRTAAGSRARPRA